MAELAVKNLRKSFGQNEVLKGVSFTVESGKFLSLLGPSGCGKSTILRIICGLETPNSGEVLVDGTDVTTVRPEKRNIGMVFQNYALHERGQERGLRPEDAEGSPEGDRRARSGGTGAGEAAHLRPPPHQPALRRRAAAHRAGPRV